MADQQKPSGYGVDDVRPGEYVQPTNHANSGYGVDEVVRVPTPEELARAQAKEILAKPAATSGNAPTAISKEPKKEEKKTVQR